MAQEHPNVLLFKGMKPGNLAAAAELFAPDAVFHYINPRWPDIQGDYVGMDGIRSLMEGGTHGNLATLEPQLSPMLWTSIATGKMAYHHGVQGFTEVDPVTGGVVPVSAATRQCKTLWEMLGEHGLRSHIISWFATQGERDQIGRAHV